MHGCIRNTISVLPMRTESPMSTRVPESGMTRNVPALDSQSVRNQSPSTCEMRACTDETVKSACNESPQLYDEPCRDGIRDGIHRVSAPRPRRLALWL